MRKRACTCRSQANAKAACAPIAEQRIQVDAREHPELTPEREVEQHHHLLPRFGPHHWVAVEDSRSNFWVVQLTQVLLLPVCVRIVNAKQTALFTVIRLA